MRRPILLLTLALLTLAVLPLAAASHLSGYLSSVYFIAAPPRAVLADTNYQVQQNAFTGGNLPAEFAQANLPTYPVRVRYSDLSANDLRTLGSSPITRYILVEGAETPYEPVSGNFIYANDRIQQYGGEAVYRLALRNTANRNGLIAEALLFYAGWAGTVGPPGICTNPNRRQRSICAVIYHTVLPPAQVPAGAELAIDFYDALAEAQAHTPLGRGRVIVRAGWAASGDGGALQCAGQDHFALNCRYDGNIPAALLDSAAAGPRYDGSLLALRDGGAGNDALLLTSPSATNWADPAARAGWKVRVYRRNGQPLTPELYLDREVSVNANTLTIPLQPDTFQADPLAALNGQMLAFVFIHDEWAARIARVPAGGLGFQVSLMLITLLGGLFGLKRLPLERRFMLTLLATAAVAALPAYFFGVGNPFLPVVLALVALLGLGLPAYLRRG